MKSGGWGHGGVGARGGAVRSPRGPTGSVSDGSLPSARISQIRSSSSTRTASLGSRCARGSRRGRPSSAPRAEWWRQVAQGLSAEIARMKAAMPRCEWRAYPGGPQCFREAGHRGRWTVTLELDDVIEVEPGRSVRLKLGIASTAIKRDWRGRIAVRNVVTNRLSYIPEWRLLRCKRREGEGGR